MQGEAAHEAGRDGARRAKSWLEATSRVDACWVNPDEGAREKLTFAWPQGGQAFSFDLGGRLRYGKFDGQLFYAEVKNYTTSSKLPGYYREFLAKFYVAYKTSPAYADNFYLAPFAAQVLGTDLAGPKDVLVVLVACATQHAK